MGFDELNRLMREATDGVNLSESVVAAQIILIASAVLAIVGALVFNNNLAHVSVITGTLLLISVLGLGLSLLSGVVHFWSERKFWESIRQELLIRRSTILSTISKSEEQELAAETVTKDFSRGSNRFFWVVQLLSFVSGMGALLLLLIARIIGKM